MVLNSNGESHTKRCSKTKYRQDLHNGLVQYSDVSCVMRPFCLVESCLQDAAANASVLSVIPHAYSVSLTSVVD